MAGLSVAIASLLPGMSPLIVAIVLGVLAANLLRLPASLLPGIGFSAKRLLRAGVVLLGLKLALADVVALGVPMLLVIVAIVSAGVLGTVLMGRMLGVPRRVTLLLACGSSICGAAAVAGVAGVLDPDDEHEDDTVTAVALVVVFGTLMIPLIPALARLQGMGPEAAGMWAGGAIHEVAQVVAAGGLIGGGALTVAVVVKLGRVLMLAPIVAILSLRQRRLGRRMARGSLPPLVPAFVLGFLAMVALRSFVPPPSAVLQAAGFLQTGLLAAAMFALGCGVRLATLAKVGLRPVLLAAFAAVLVALVSLVGVALAG